MLKQMILVELMLRILYVGLELVTPKKKITSYSKIVGYRGFKKPDTSNPYVYAEFTDPSYDVMPLYPMYSQVYEVNATCSYFENKSNGTIVSHSFVLNAGRKTLSHMVTHYGPYGIFELSSGGFYDKLENDILTYGDTINTIKRALDKVYFTCYAGNADLALILESDLLSTGFTSDIIDYSNIANGIGFFTSYRQIDTDEIPFPEETVDSVITRFGNKYKFVRGSFD
jgi:hypothetical protein